MVIPWRAGVAGGVLAAVAAGAVIHRAISERRRDAERVEIVPIERVVGEPGRAPGQYSYPRAIDAGAGSLWVVDKSARIQRIDPATGACTSWWRMPEWEFGKPTGVTVRVIAGRTMVFVPDTHYHRVMMYEAPSDGGEAALRGSFGRFGRGNGEFIFPTDVAVLTTPDDSRVLRLYVSEYGENDRISVFEPTASAAWEFAFTFSFGRFGDGDDGADTQFNRPQSMVIDDSRRELVVADGCNHRLGRFTLDGELLGWIGNPAGAGDAIGEFQYPYGLVALGDGTVIVTEFGNARVQRIELATGRVLGALEAPDGPNRRLITPWGAAVLDDELYVLDSGNNRVAVWPVSILGAAALAGANR